MQDCAIDSSVLVAYLSGEETVDSHYVQKLIQSGCAYLPPIALSELLSYPHLTTLQAKILIELPLLPIDDGYWQRVGEVRRRLLAKGLKAHLPDTLIAQSCIDHGVPLLTRDKDFHAYADHCGLKLAVV